MQPDAEHHGRGDDGRAPVALGGEAERRREHRQAVADEQRAPGWARAPLRRGRPDQGEEDPVVTEVAVGVAQLGEASEGQGHAGQGEAEQRAQRERQEQRGAGQPEEGRRAQGQSSVRLHELSRPESKRALSEMVRVQVPAPPPPMKGASDSALLSVPEL